MNFEDNNSVHNIMGKEEKLQGKQLYFGGIFPKSYVSHSLAYHWQMRQNFVTGAAQLQNRLGSLFSSLVAMSTDKSQKAMLF